MGKKGLGGPIRLAFLSTGCAAATAFALLKVLPILRLHHIDSYFIFTFLSLGWSSAVFSPITAYLTATRNPGVVLPNIDAQFALTMSASKNFCKTCGVSKQDDNPKRIHHCRQCTQCVADFDHHCGVVGVCIGRGNRVYFIALLCWGAIGYITLFTGTVKAIFAQPPNEPLILGLNVPAILLWSGSFFTACFALFVS
jgi:hypothetical protein